MTPPPHSPSSPTSPSRRSFLASTVVAAAAVSGGLPLLTACGSSDSGSKEGTTSGKAAEKILPAYAGKHMLTPDLPSKNGSSAAFTQKIELGELKQAVPEKLGKGSKFTVMAPFWGTPPKGDCAYYTAMNEAIGIKATWRNQDGNTYDEKLGAVLASSDIPDVVVVPGWNLNGKIPGAVISKFEDLGPYLSGDKVKKYPNLAAIPSDAWQRSIFGGALRGLPMPSSYVTNIVPFYRKDIFDKRGYELPKSAAQWLDLLKEINDPKGKSWATGDLKWAALRMFGVFSGDEKALGWMEVDGKLTYRIETDAYLEALEWTRKVYAADLVHPDSKAVKGDERIRFAAGDHLFFCADITAWYQMTAEQANAKGDFEVGGMDYFNHDGGDPTLWATQPANLWAFIRKGTSKAVIRDVLATANFTAAPFGSKERMLTKYGVEGTHYEVKDGVPVKNDKGNTEVLGAFDYTGAPQSYLAQPDLPDVTREQAKWQQRMGAFTKKSTFYGLTIAEPNRYTNLSNDFEQLEDDIVRGRKKISDMQQAVSDWKRKGGDKLRDWYTELHEKQGS
ncbi:Tat pathway signal sequence domain protein [Streptomyces boninensis]|uniref:Tat pathway signal sequence domain protein n=1 Tax=Streptomyces boninensis TaxID=2039455 RepID=UPI003B21580D